MERPVLPACRNDGDWIMAYGRDDHEQSAQDWGVIHLAHLLDCDATLNAIADLRADERAERNAVGEPWVGGLVAR